MKKILVVGSSNTDIIIQVPKLPRPGETVIGSAMQMVQGGKGANQAVTSARLGAKTVFMASVGNDDFGDEAIKGYALDGIDTRFIKRSNGSTGVALINIDSRGENSISVNPGANANLNPDDIVNDLFDNVSFMLVQMEIAESTITKAVNLAFENDVKVILNPAPAMELKNFPFHKIFLFTPNETEAEFYTGISIRSDEDADISVKQLHSLGIQNVIITLGKNGAYCSFNQFKGRINGFPAKAVDTTAAGDVFNGAIAAGLVRYNDLQRAIRFAHGAAALSVKKIGAQTSIPYLESVLQLTGLQ